jgi:hypothetical protein
MSETSTLEVALARTESDLDAVLKVSAALAAQLRRAKKAAANGAVRDLERALEGCTELAGEVREAVRAGVASWSFDIQGYLESGDYRREVLSLARERGLQLHEQDDRLISFPSLVRVVSNDASVEVDRKRNRSIRPSVLIDALGAAQ